jgi:hypothetical protein
MNLPGLAVAAGKRKLVRRYVDEVYLHAPSALAGAPTIFVSNHQAYWDAAIAGMVAGEVGKTLRVQASQVVLRDFPFLRWLGISGVDETDPMSVAQALAADREHIGASEGHALWLFAQGPYRAPEDASMHFRRGASHLVRKLPEAAVIPVAIRYDVLRTRKPVVYVDLGDDIRDRVRGLGRDACTQELQAAHADVVTDQARKLRDGTGCYTPLLANRKGSFAIGRFFYAADVRRQLRAVPGVTNVEVQPTDPGFAITMHGPGDTSPAAVDFLIDRYSLEDVPRHVVEKDFKITWRTNK